MTKYDENSDIVFTLMDMNTTLSKDVVLRSSPFSNYPNKAGSLKKGTAVYVSGISDEFVRIIYDGNIFYINDVDCFVMKLNPVNFVDAQLNSKVIKQVDLLKQPYDFIRNNVVGKLEINQEILVTGLNKDYVRVKVDNKEYYVNDVEFYDVIKDNTSGSSGKSNS